MSLAKSFKEDVVKLWLFFNSFQLLNVITSNFN